MPAAANRTNPMDNDSQILIPPSFIALYLPGGRSKPTLPRAELAARYELCEDLANLLVEHARGMLHGQGVSEDEVLVRCHRGLLSEGSGVETAESVWVVRRLAELLEWRCPELAGAPGEAPAAAEPGQAGQ